MFSLGQKLLFHVRSSEAIIGLERRTGQTQPRILGSFIYTLRCELLQLCLPVCFTQKPAVMDKLNNSCLDVRKYPKNLICPDTYEHCLKKYFDQLEADDKRLFCEEDDSAVDFWQFQDDSKGE